MKRAARVLAFIVLCLSAAAGLVLLFPSAKEGYSWSDLPLLLGNAGALFGLAGLWWLIVGRSASRAAIGWVILAIPIVLTLTVIVLLLAARIEGARLAKAVRIEHYAEAPILWPGFDGPVGMEITITLRHPEGVDALIAPPEIRMAPVVDIPADRLYATRTNGAGYFKDHYLENKTGPIALLKSVLVQSLYAERFASRRFEAGEVTKLRYHLHPGTVDLLESRGRLCLMSRSAGVPRCALGVESGTGCLRAGWPQITTPVYSVGGDLTALWLAAGGNDMFADFSEPLTETLRRNSTLQSDPEAWRAMQQRLEPEGLMRAGYRICPPDANTHTASRVCYCRADG
jgi:hypothetical protein